MRKFRIKYTYLGPVDACERAGGGGQPGLMNSGGLRVPNQDSQPSEDRGVAEGFWAQSQHLRPEGSKLNFTN